MTKLLMSLSASALMLTGIHAFAAEGSVHMSAPELGAYMDLDQTGTTVKGTMNFSGSPFVNLTKGNDGWQGSFGARQVAVTKVTTNSNGSADVEITTVPGGTYSIHFTHKEGVGMEINGTTPQGSLISAVMKHPKHDFSAQLGRNSYYLAPSTRGNYTGTLALERNGSFVSANLSLKTDGTLDFHTVMHQDPALFSLLFLISLN